jgi:hypothetical protein
MALPEQMIASVCRTDGDGYWIASTNGTADQYDDASNDGGISSAHLNGSIIAASGF